MKNKLPVIIGLAVVALAVFFLLNMGNGKDTGREVGVLPIELQDMPRNVREYLEQNVMTEKYLAFRYEGDVYLFAARGEMMTGGFAVVLKDARFKDGILQISAEKRNPGKDEMVTQALTYPVHLVKLAERLEIKEVRFVDMAGKQLARAEIMEIAKLPETAVDLYFGVEDGTLRKERRIINAEITPENAYLLVEELIKGTENPGNTLNVLPAGTTILNYQYDSEKKMAIIDLGGNIRDARGSMGEIFAIFSIVNTLTEVEGIEMVQILIEGQKVESLSGHIYLMEPLKPDYSLLEDNQYK